MMDASIVATLGSLITGVFGGIGATLTWEMLLKPAQERRALAASLAEELHYNARRAAEEDARAAQITHGIPRTSNLSTAVFEAAAARVGDLGAVTGHVFAYYRLVNLLRQLVAEHARLLYEHEHRTPAMSDARVAEMAAELSYLARRYETEFGRLHEMSMRLLPDLRRAALPAHKRIARRGHAERAPNEAIDLIVAGNRDAGQISARKPPNEALQLTGYAGPTSTPSLRSSQASISPPASPRN